MTPGTFIRTVREAGTKPLTCDDVALCLDSVPAISHRARVELLEQIEADLVPVSVSTAVALASVLEIDLERLAELVDAHPSDPSRAPRLRRAARGLMWIAIPGEAAA